MDKVTNSRFLKNLKIMAVICLICAVLLSGCADKGQNETGNNSEQNNTDDTGMETEQVVTEADNGTGISLKNGEAFLLELRENPSTGYSWELNLSEGLTILSDNYTQDPAPEDQVGVSGTHSWEIKAVAQGSQQVNGIYKRPWENTTGTEDNFTLSVEVA